jgi:hypothetical protein
MIQTVIKEKANYYLKNNIDPEMSYEIGIEHYNQLSQVNSDIIRHNIKNKRKIY